MMMDILLKITKLSTSSLTDILLPRASLGVLEHISSQRSFIAAITKKQVHGIIGNMEGGCDRVLRTHASNIIYHITNSKKHLKFFKRSATCKNPKTSKKLFFSKIVPSTPASPKSKSKSKGPNMHNTLVLVGYFSTGSANVHKICNRKKLWKIASSPFFIGNRHQKTRILCIWLAPRRPSTI